jgi:hypothetical protein
MLMIGVRNGSLKYRSNGKAVSFATIPYIGNIGNRKTNSRNLASNSILKKFIHKLGPNIFL